MPEKRVRRVEARQGYDYWSDTYDSTPNPVVAMDARHTLELLAPARDERILDAGCGTGRNFDGFSRAGSRAVGIDFSMGMLKIARAKHPRAPLVQGNIEQPFPFKSGSFDAVLCALVGEHLSDLKSVFRESFSALKRGGRFVFSVYHPEMAAAGKEANFQRGGVEFRLGAFRHTLSDYLSMLDEAGFSDLALSEFRGDDALARVVPGGQRYIDFPVLLVIRANKMEE
ncbi:MAG TPA: class I SAM-dependent methyltransferase [Blastocatellia bacterium]